MRPFFSCQITSNLHGVLIGAVDKEKIKLEGGFDFEMNEITQGKQNIASALVDEVFGSSGKIKRRMDDIASFEDNIRGIGNEFKEDPGILGDLGKSLLSFASFIDPATGVIGFAVGVADYISSFTNIFGGGSTQTKLMVGRGSMHLTGTITDNFKVDFHKFGLPLVEYSNPNEETNFQGPVGLFSLKRKPEVTVVQKQFHYSCRNDRDEQYRDYVSYGLYLQYDDQNMENLFRVNPESGMQLIEVNAVPYAIVQGPFLGLNYWPHYDAVYKEGISVQEYSYGLKLYSGAGAVHRFRTAEELPQQTRFDEGYLRTCGQSE